MPEKGSDVRVEGSIKGPFPETLGANWFQLTRLDTDVQVSVGYYDMRRLVEALEKAKAIQKEQTEPTPVSVAAEIEPIARFVVGRSTLKLLKESVNRIYDDMVKSGHIEQGVDNE